MEDERASFIRRTYMHLAGAIAGFTLLEIHLLKSELATEMLSFISGNRYGWLMVLGAFVLVGWMARGLASRARSTAMQYAGLALYTVAEAVIFVPILYLAVHYSERSVLNNALLLTGAMFAGLTFIAFTTRKDFSFLGGILAVGGFVALGLIAGGVVFGFDLGLAFSVGMVALASGSILYDTSKIIHHYSSDQHVAAALELFASVALLFWYVLRILMRFSRR
ncbi:MAG: permease [Candidatus Aegiribacteria sp. MLS_C]|nr:MAG: permease [Candidatus Aegiribacteria sp. MLS_C]